MELFKPSKRILEAICDNEKIIYSYEIIPRTSDKRTNEECSILSLTGLVSKIREFYKIDINDESRKKLDSQKVCDVTWEALCNCLHHGPEDKDIWFGLFLGEKGVCYGFHDGGDYFLNEDIKNQYENKKPIKIFGKNTSHQVGVNFCIYPNSDMIEVDLEKGILYCVQFKRSIIC